MKKARKMLIKLIPAVNFIDVLQTDFTILDPKSAKKNIDGVTAFFVHLEFACIKAAHRSLMKFSPNVITLGQKKLLHCTK